MAGVRNFWNLIGSARPACPLCSASSRHWHPNWHPFPEAKSILNELREHYCSAERLYVRKGCELCWVLRNECDYCSGSKLRIGCFSPAASRLRRCLLACSLFMHEIIIRRQPRCVLSLLTTYIQ